jgi:hypothetical protein
VIGRWLPAVLAALLAIGIGGCGGGGGGTVADGGIGGTGISSGSITGMGSIFVNGRRFEIESAEITINGTPAMSSRLEVGYVVDVRADFDDGIAENVAFRPNLVGEVDADNVATGADTGSFTVLRQTVHISPTTVIGKGDTLDEIGRADRVLVSGYRNSRNEVVASHVRLLTGGGFPIDQIVGRVDSVIPGTSFTIGGLTIFTNKDPEVGERVVVRGDYDPGTQRFDADSIEEIEDLGSGERAEAELEGIVDAFTNSASFTVNGIAVDGSSATVEGGSLGQDAEVEVEGVFNGNGVLVADRIEVDREDTVTIEADVSSTEPDAGLVLFFTDQLAVKVNDKTRIRDDRDDRELFGIRDIAQGDWLEIEGYVEADSVVATRLEREDPNSAVVIGGPLENVDDFTDTVTLLGLGPIDVSSADFSGGIDRTADLNVGDVVEIGWDNFSGLGQPADEIALED